MRQESSVLAAFGESAQFSIGKQWLRALGLYVIVVAIYILVSPDTLHGHFFEMYFLSAPYDLIVFSVTLPIFNNMMVYMLNDLRLIAVQST